MCVCWRSNEKRLAMLLDSHNTFCDFFIKLVNNGPSSISQTVLELHCPLSSQGQTLLYPLEFSTQGPVNCTSDKTLNALHLEVSRGLTPSAAFMLVYMNSVTERERDGLHGNPCGVKLRGLQLMTTSGSG